MRFGRGFVLFIFLMEVCFCTSVCAENSGVERATAVGALLLPADTQVTFSLDKPVSSRVASIGDKVCFSTMKKVCGKTGYTLIPEGSAVEGIVTSVRKASIFSQSGRVIIANLRVMARDNCFYPLAGNLVVQGGGDQTSALVIAIGISWPVALFSGSEIDAPAGTVFSAPTFGDVWCKVPAEKPDFAGSRYSVGNAARAFSFAAADHGDSSAAYRVGLWAYYGIGMAPDPILAQKYLKLALKKDILPDQQKQAENLLKKLAKLAIVF